MSSKATNQKPEQLAGLALNAGTYSGFQITPKTACQRYPDGRLFPVNLQSVHPCMDYCMLILLKSPLGQISCEEFASA